MRIWKPIYVLLAILIAAFGVASGVQIRLEPESNVGVADQRSTLTITATLFTGRGELVPDGTPVVFEATNATFRENAVTTVQGRARAVLISPAIPGTCTITASAPSFGAISKTEIEFFSDRSLLKSAKDFIEVVAPNPLAYSPSKKLLNASGKDLGVRVRYRDILISADDVQIDVPNYIVRARKAVVKIGRNEIPVEQLWFRLNARKGFAVGTRNADSLVDVRSAGPVLVPVVEARPSLGLAEISSSGLKATEEGFSEGQFKFVDDDESITTILAKRCVAFPRRELQFQDATITAGGAKVAKIPLYRIGIEGTDANAFQIFTVRDNKIGIDYPYFLNLQPGLTTNLRLRTGESYSRGLGASSRISLDYEMQWNRGDEMNGGLILSGMTRKDWSLGARQFIRFGDDSTLSLNADMAAQQSLFGSLNYSKPFKGFALNLISTNNRSLRGPQFSFLSNALNLESDPIRSKKSPITLFYGLSATYDANRFNGTTTENRTFGMRLRSMLTPQAVDRNTTLNASASVTRTLGRTSQPFVVSGSMSLARQINSQASMLLMYDYLDDGFNSRQVGKHRLTITGNINAGRFNMSLYGNRAIDVPRLNIFLDVAYGIGGKWGLAYSHTYTQFNTEITNEFFPMLTYNLGQQTIGLAWSNRTKRFGLQLLGTTFR
ncbi:MAG: Ig-like domain-containing protein [Armatimonadetes bacterium]|nr:Ig-like domain-containing protein [Armatimonadota bacterium]